MLMRWWKTGVKIYWENKAKFINTVCWISTVKQAPVVQTLEVAIHRINRYPVDKYYENELRYPPFEQLGPEQQGNWY